MLNFVFFPFHFFFIRLFVFVRKILYLKWVLERIIKNQFYMMLYLVVSDIVKILLKNGEKETLECVTIATRGEASSAIVYRYQMAIEATAGINLQTMSLIWCKIMGNIRMAGNWILFLDVDLFTENRSLEVLQNVKRHAIARKD